MPLDAAGRIGNGEGGLAVDGLRRPAVSGQVSQPGQRGEESVGGADHFMSRMAGPSNRCTSRLRPPQITVRTSAEGQPLQIMELC